MNYTKLKKEFEAQQELKFEEEVEDMLKVLKRYNQTKKEAKT